MTTLVRLAKRARGSGIDDFRRLAERVGDWSCAAPHGLRRATRALTLPGTYRRGEPACDVIDELAFDDEASAARCLADPAFRRAWASPLLDPDSVACLVVEEHVAKSGPVPASYVKNYELVTKRPDLDRAEFDRYWAQVHGPLAATIPAIRRYVQGSTWGDWGEDDELGRINLITTEKVLEGVREVQAGKSFCLSLPLDFPGGSSLNQRRYPPIIRPTEDLVHKPDTFYNVVAKDSISPSYIDVWSDDMVTLWTQYSTQWDALVHQGALFDADGDGVAEPLYYNGFKPHVDIIGPKEDAKGDGSGSVAFARHLGLEHMAAHGVQGRAVLIDVAHHLNHTEEWTAVPMKTVREIMTADRVEVRPGDMVVIHTGFTQKILEWDKHPDESRIQAMYPYLDGEDPEVLEWITDSQMSALIADNYAVEGWPAPTPEPHTLIPVHNLCLFKLGIPLGEMWHTQELATWLRANGRSSFLLTAPPLRLPGTAGGPLNPIATV